MKTEKFNAMKRENEVLNAYGKQTFANGKKQMKLNAAIDAIENTSDVDIVTFTLNHFRSSFNLLDKSIKGEAKKRFCAACYDAIKRNGIIYFFNVDGTINANRVVNSIRSNDDKELAILVSNMISGEFERYEERKNEERKNEALNAYCEAMQDELNTYSIAAFLIA